MAKQLTVTGPPNGRAVAPSTTETLIATLPKWLQYLVGAFPAAQVNELTYLAYETAFTEIDPEVMLAAVQAVVRQHKFATFPTIAEIDQMATARATRNETAVLDERGQMLAALASERHELLELAYAGEFDPAAWASLTSQYETAGFEINAAWARRKVAQFAVAA